MAEELRRLRRQLRATERQLELREAELDLLRGSHSFKLTAPLRWLRRRLSASPAPQPSVDSVLSDVTRLPAAVGAFPKRFVQPGPPERLNESHRPLRLDVAIQPLVPLAVAEGSLREEASPYSERYYGDLPNPVRVATITSAEFRQELSFDASVLPLHASTWADQLAPGRVDALLLDGAWEPEGGWGAGFGGSPSSQQRLAPLFEYCQRHSVPVVLWAREDAQQLERLQWLLPWVARVYAVDAAGEQWFRSRFPELGVGCLPPAVQPALFNPVRSYGLRDCAKALSGTVLFDGWWSVSSGRVSDPVLGVLGDRLRIVDTDGDYSWARLQDIGSYASLALGSVTPLEKSALLRSGSAELFLEHSGGSPWRLTERMLRAAASGAAIFAKGAHAHAPVKARELPNGAEPGTFSTLQPTSVEHARDAHLAFRNVLQEHCLADRLAMIWRDLGLNDGRLPGPTPVAHLLVTMRPELLERCLARFRNDLYPERELVVVLHGDGVDIQAARALIKDSEPVRLLQAPSTRSLGDCLNMAIAHTEAPFWMKMDDDDHYGPAYTRDMMLYRRAIRAPLMGKPPAFLHLGATDELRWDAEWASLANLLHHPDEANAALVAGGTLAGTREVLESEGFSSSRRGGSDSEFIERCLEGGHSLLATDAFNFARFRSGDEGFHTWKVSDTDLLQRTVPAGSGAALEQQVFI
ncbi:hypothetical protein BGP89_06980 [Luteimonas sp. JM171]|uniref:glycosyltransferase family 2 protein n=1 Tax=Luteimonas sp. JM171 TaxID=1896164 RepID=UPI0012FB8D17|nr:glycosyltransferase [Luteimonas sp. JM171]